MANFTGTKNRRPSIASRIDSIRGALIDSPTASFGNGTGVTVHLYARTAQHAMTERFAFPGFDLRLEAPAAE
jgi:hypothetical protein